LFLADKEPVCILANSHNEDKQMKATARFRALVSVYFIASIDNCGYAMVFVLFPALLLNPDYDFLPKHPGLAAKLMAMGVLYAAFPIAQFFGAPVVGELADRFGRKKIFFITILGTIFGYFLTGATLALKSISLVFISRFITGLFSANQGLCNASIADLSPDEKQRAKNYGILTVVWGLSFPIALLLGGFLSDPAISKHFSPSLPFYIVGLITVLSLLTLLFFYPETYQVTEKRLHLDIIKGFHNIIEALKMQNTRKFFFLMLVWTIGWGFSVTWYGAYCIQKFHISQEVVTVGLIIQGFFWTLGGALAKPILLRYLTVKSIAKLSFLIATLFLIASACMPTFHTFILVYSLSAVMGAVSLSSTFNLISISSPATVQGKAMGIAQSMMSLGFFLVPIFGSISGSFSIDTFYPISALFLAIGFVTLLKK
jgi:MFS transporter, DHA1 family, tetracycline resistance protein